MGANNTVGSNNVLSRLPEWLGGIIGSGSAAPRPSQPPNEHEAGQHAVLETSASGERACGDIESMIDEMLAQGRYALLLRPQLIEKLSAQQLARTRTALSEGMCLIPAGPVVLHGGPGGVDAALPAHPPSFRVNPLYLDRYPVTNAQFFQFVAAGGYEQMAIWDAEIWPALLDFVDATGHPGPRFWKNGRFPRGEDHHPLVGVSWYEAVAYARWVGKRLPSGPEWVKAGSWPVSIEGHPLLLRRYPWGEAMDRARANLWGSGPGRTASVFEFPGGVSVGGAHQLIGNVWEWMADDHAPGGVAVTGVTLETRMKSLRGGAFDTYLDCQATCQFDSGEVALARKHNVGFRCAIGMCDLASRPDESADSGEDDATEPSQPENQP